MKPGHSKRAHAVLSPSGADRWFHCTASVKPIEALGQIDTSSPAAEEGTAAHELLEASLKKGKEPTHKSWLGKIFNKEWRVTSEMAEAVQVAYDFALELELDGWTILSEQKNPIACTLEGGTCDICAHKKNKLKIIDYKHGRGVIVSAEKNMQTRLYALGAIDSLGIRETVEEVELIIIQPRAQRDPVIWMDDVNDLFAFERQVVQKRKDIAADKVSFVPTEKGCKWCPLRHECKAYMEAATKAMKLDFENVTSECPSASMKKITPKDINALALNMDFIKGWLKTVDNEIFRLAAKGALKDFKVVQGSADRKWVDEDVVLTALRRLEFDEDIYRPRKLVGLGVVGKLFTNKDKRENFMKKHTIRPDGKPIVVGSDDSRPAVNPADDFAGITNKE